MPIQSSSTSTYDPRANSPIKAPNVEFCITCGQQLPSKVKPMINDMSNYLNGDDRKGVVVVASVEPTLELKGVTFYRIKAVDPEGNYITYVPLPGAKVELSKTAYIDPSWIKANKEAASEAEIAKDLPNPTEKK